MRQRVIPGSLIINDEGIFIAFCGAAYSMMLLSLLLNYVHTSSMVIYRLGIINCIFIRISVGVASTNYNGEVIRYICAQYS